MTSPLRALVIAHTHWDREWYHPAGHFRHRLVALVDELLDDPPPHGESFLLDGQAILLDDYLAVQDGGNAAEAVAVVSSKLSMRDSSVPSRSAVPLCAGPLSGTG